MRRQYFNLLLVTTALSFCLPSYAATPVIRANDRDGSTRLVMEWDVPPKFTQKTIDDKTVEISFEQSIAPDLEALKKLNGLSDIRIVSEPNMPTRLWLSLSKAGTVRAFAAGNRLIIDIPQDPDFKKPVPEKVAEVPKPEAVPVQTVESAPIPDAAPALSAPREASVLQFTTTEQVPVAAYIRDGLFNLVLDQPDIDVPPPFVTDASVKAETFEVPQASGFSYKAPKGMIARAQGGGLNWKIIFSNSKDVVQKTSDPIRVSSPEGKASLQFKLPSANRVIETKDKKRGQKLFIIPVTSSNDSAGSARQFAEFEVLASPAGLTVAAKVDDLAVQIKEGVVTISRPNGLALSTVEEAEKYDSALRQTKITQPAAVKPLTEPPPSTKAVEPVTTTEETRIFRFDRWDMGGVDALQTNTQILLSGAANRTPDDRVQDLLTLAKLNLSNGKGSEALGFLDLALENLPILEGNPEFLAIRGASHAIAGQYDKAFADLSSPKLNAYSEANIWRAFVLSNLQDWKQATEKMPASFGLPSQYPQELKYPIMLAMAEIALRAGDIDRAEKALAIVEKDKKDLNSERTEHLRYLEAELARQKGEKEKAKEIWSSFSKSKDDYFRARGGMALASMLIENGEVKPKDAVDKLEGLRFSWRGDELEASINQKLGEMYLDAGETLKGLSVLRTAVTLMPGSETASRITAIMADAFKKLFLGDAFGKVNPMDAVTIHEEFPELLPMGEDGDRVTDALVDRLVAVDLVPRAAKILQYQIEHRLTGDKAVAATLRLASLFLLDQKPKEAMETLQKVQNLLTAAGTSAKEDHKRDMTLMRAKALSQMKQPEQAFEMLSDLPQDFDVLSLKADIAWQTGRWTEASAALADIVFQEDIQPTRPPTDDQASMILNWAVAMNLAGDRSGLGSLREKYGDLMKQTSMNDTFEVVTRPRQTTLLADRDTLNSMISEVDLFKDFLAAYRAKPAPKEAPKPVAKTETAPATETSTGQ